MRIPIRIQLLSLILIASLIGLAVISIALWITTHKFVLDVRASRLALTASLKAAQLASNLDVMQTSTSFISTRVLVQYALRRYNNDGNNTQASWSFARADMQAAIGGEASLGQQLLLQSRVYPKNATGVNGAASLLDSTADSLIGKIALPYHYPDGSPIYLGDNSTDAGPYGYPPSLYPNLTYFSERVGGRDVARAQHGDRVLYQNTTLLLGPIAVNSTLSLVSMTMTVVNNTDSLDVLGFLTIAMNAELISQVMDSQDGLDDTGQTLIIGPSSDTNRYSTSIMDASGDKDKPDIQVRYILPLNETYAKRHPEHVRSTSNQAFSASDFPAIYQALSKANANSTNAMGANLKAKNEAGKKVSVGYAMTRSNLVNWIVIVEQSRSEVWEPINTLRNVILACLFATLGFMVVVSFPLAHFASVPILRLRQATARSIEPPGSNSRCSMDSGAYIHDGTADSEDVDAAVARKEGFVPNPVRRWRRKREESSQAKREERQKRVFRIPAKVKERTHWVKDELSDLTSTFNEMSDELMMQYTKLEERVQQRTAELELSKKAAEAANESKTLFIANISHELKTPLNGILGMCAVCMQEDDPLRLKRSLGIIYKSGDLLLNLLTDLLTFSKNQVGQHLSLDEKEFRLRDIQTQILAIFEKQAKEGNIDLRVEFEGINHTNNFMNDVSPERQSAIGPSGTGRMRHMILWGDVHRILQVVINLVSNSLKFTPPGGAVTLTIRALQERPEVGSRQSSLSRQSRRQSSRHRESQRESVSTVDKMGTANAIYVKGKPHTMTNVSERAVSPPPGRYVYFEFEVEDTGPGIPDNLQSKIFEPFVQGDLGLSKKFGGTGLGLSICSQLASLMQGSMRVRSHVGLGSTFTMKIPLRHVQSRADSSASSAVEKAESISRSDSFDDEELLSSKQPSHGPVEYNSSSPTPPEVNKDKVSGDVSNNSNPRLVGLSQPFFAASQPLESPGSQPAAMKQMSEEVARGGKIRVLVAEDNKVNQEVVLRMLKLEDIYDVTVAKDGQEALDLVKESMRGEGQPFNLIFMDVQMPNVDGLQSTRLIREIGYQAPIVALTAFAEESNIKDCLDSGMNYFLSKPIRRPQLKKVLKEYCAPIPEETEEAMATPPEERRGSGVNTTIVMVNNKAPEDATAANDGRGLGMSALLPKDSLADGSKRSGEDDRPVSPRNVS